MKQSICDPISVVINQEMIDGFLKKLQEKGRKDCTIKEYSRYLHSFYEFLPKDKLVTKDVLIKWKNQFAENEVPVRTANTKISAVNSFLNFTGQKNLQMSPFSFPKENIQPELTRAEYNRLLQSAKIEGKERTYFIIKMIACTGIRLQYLAAVTVENIKEGTIVLPEGGIIRIPELLQKELLDYAQRNGVYEGFLFLTRSGIPIERTNINRSIKLLCRDARVPEEKANPICLRKLYETTYSGIQEHIEILVEQAYNRLLEKEEQTIGWDK